MFKCRVILENGDIISGVIEELQESVRRHDVIVTVRTPAPPPKDLVSFHLLECKKITITKVKDHADFDGIE